MTGLLLAVVALAAGSLVITRLPVAHRRLVAEHDDPPVRRILLPFTGAAISRRALEAAVRLARAENAVIMPAFLARVPRHLSLDSPLPAQCLTGMPVLEAIEQRATAQGVQVDTRVSRGRSYRHALERLLENESFDRIIVSATPNPRTGLTGRDIDWLLEDAPAEIMILRPAPTDKHRVSGEAVTGHF